MPKPHILVVGGGAAGLIAAGTAAENDASVTVAVATRAWRAR